MTRSPATHFADFGEVQVGDEQARRAAVRALERLALVLRDHPGLAVAEVLDRELVVQPP